VVLRMVEKGGKMGSLRGSSAWGGAMDLERGGGSKGWFHSSLSSKYLRSALLDFLRASREGLWCF